jgi:hypothetical protein
MPAARERTTAINRQKRFGHGKDVTSFLAGRMKSLIWAHFRYFVPETGLSAPIFLPVKGAKSISASIPCAAPNRRPWRVGGRGRRAIHGAPAAGSRGPKTRNQALVFFQLNRDFSFLVF